LVMVNGNVKPQTGMRLDRLLYDRFKELCKREKLRPNEATELLMQMCLEAESVKAILSMQSRQKTGFVKAEELKLKGALSHLKTFIEAVEKRKMWILTKGRPERIDQVIYLPAYEAAVAALPSISDPELVKTTEEVLEKANKALEEMVSWLSAQG
jgi:hypothetical protein